MWHERYGGRADVLGKELKLNSRIFTIIGVLPKAAEFPGGVRLWVPMQGDPNVNDSSYSFDGLARLKPGVTLEQANADLVRTQQVIFDTRDKERVVTPFARDLREQFTRDFGTVASTLGAAVSLLLIVACANVAALMLARALVTPARNRHPSRRRRQPRPAAATAARREHHAVDRRRRGRARDRAMGDQPARDVAARSGAELDHVHARRPDDRLSRSPRRSRPPFSSGGRRRFTP